MLSGLSIFLIITVAFEFIRNSNRGIFLYLLLSFFAPYIDIGTLTFRSELLAAPLLLLITVIKKREAMVLTFPFFLWLGFVLYCILVSFLSDVKAFESVVNYISIFNYFRFAALILIGANLDFSDKALVNLQRFLLLASIPICFLSLGVIFQNNIAGWITKNFFTSPTRSVYETQLLSLDFGYAFRSIGVFENVSYYATYILIVIAIGVLFLLMGEKSSIKRSLVLFCLFVNFLAGISTSSMTFYIGFFIISFYYFLKRPIHAFRSLTILCFLVISFGIIFWESVKESLTLYLDVFNYLVASFLEGDKLMERYLLSNRDTGDLSLIFKHTWVFGNGFRYFENFVVNDSLYLEFFYQGGFIGSIIIVSFVLSIFYYCFKDKLMKEHKIYLVFGLLLIAGVGCNSFAIVRFSEWLWILIGVISSDFVKKNIYHNTNRINKQLVKLDNCK